MEKLKICPFMEQACMECAALFVAENDLQSQIPEGTTEEPHFSIKGCHLVSADS